MIRLVIASAALASGSQVLAADPVVPPTQQASPTRQASPSQQPPQTHQTQPPSQAQPTPSAQPAQQVQPVQSLQPASTPEIPVAHSALLTVDAIPTGDSLALRIRRVGDKSVVHTEDIAVAVDGKNESVTPDSGGNYEVPINDLRGGGEREVDVTVGHDGIREILSGKIALPEASATGSLFRDHKQIAWWILNIVIVLIAAIAISRRKG